MFERRFHTLSVLLTIACAACAADTNGSGKTGNNATKLPDGGVAQGAGSGGFGGAAVVAGAGGGGGLGGQSGAGTGGATLAHVDIDTCSKNNAAGLSDADLKVLMAGSGKADGMRYLYPYDGTVFPRGLIAPLLMWDGGDADAVYVHIKSSHFEYKGCLKPTAAGQLQLPQDVWEMAEGVTSGPSDPYSVELSVLKGGKAKGPVSEKVILAQATLKGSIFYNSYSSKLAPSNQGAVLRIIPGKNAELFVGQAACTGCHSVSADGSRLVALQIGGASAPSGSVYSLMPNSAANPMASRTPADGTNFSGLSPDGKVYLSNAILGGGFGPRNPGGMSWVGFAGGGGGTDAKLYETDTGTVVANTGIVAGAIMPTFSPDAKLIAFNDYAINNGHGLAVMDYDAAARTAKNYRAIVTITDTMKYPGWPFVLPDDKAVVYALGTQTDFSGGNIGIAASGGAFFGGGGLAGSKGPYSNLFIADVASGGSTLLAQAMGYATPQDAATGKTYLPFGAEELDQNYDPTVSPVAAGGYFWVFFDSMRHYGNLGLQRQLWGSAVSVAADGKYVTDPSHPPFYLSGQELGTGNHRAFTALDPCKAEGATCTTGIDCCGGFCTNGMCKKPEAPRCSKIDEVCKTAADCCDKSNSCINGFCGLVIPS